MDRRVTVRISGEERWLKALGESTVAVGGEEVEKCFVDISCAN